MNIKRLYLLFIMLCIVIVLPITIWVYWPIVKGIHDFNEAKAKQEIAIIQVAPASVVTGTQSDTNNVRLVYYSDVLQDQSRLVSEYTNTNPGFEFFGVLKAHQNQVFPGTVHVYVKK